MFCQKCGKTIPDGSTYCNTCGHQQGIPVPKTGQMLHSERPPDNHMGLALVCALLCCFPIGIVSLVHADRVNSRFLTGDHVGAFQASEKAKTWGWTGIILGVIVIFLSIVAALAEASVT